MTAQTGDLLRVGEGFKEELHILPTETLKPYLDNNKSVKFITPNTSLWKGYRGVWELDKDDNLMLVDFRGHLENECAIGVEFLFPGESRVFAYWFTGILKINVGQVIEYKHRGYESVFENLINISITKGIATKITSNMVTL